MSIPLREFATRLEKAEHTIDTILINPDHDLGGQLN